MHENIQNRKEKKGFSVTWPAMQNKAPLQAVVLGGAPCMRMWWVSSCNASFKKHACCR
jgi:hypothetical protein